MAGVAHELNNPLTSVIGYAQLLEEELPTRRRRHAAAADGLAHDLRRIAEESERAARIVRNLLAFARRQSAERAPQDVADLFTRVLSLRAYEFRLNAIELETDVRARPAARARRRRPAAAGAAEPAAERGAGDARTHAAPHPGRRAACRRSARPSSCPSAIPDMAFRKTNIRRIFDPFFTTRDVGEGTGPRSEHLLRHSSAIMADRSASRAGSASAPPSRSCCRRGSTRRAGRAHGKCSLSITSRASATTWRPCWPAGAQVSVADGGDAARAAAAGGFDAAFIDPAGMAADLAAWRSARSTDAERTRDRVVDETDDDERSRGLRQEARVVLTPPFDLRALRAALRAVSKECV